MEVLRTLEDGPKLKNQFMTPFFKMSEILYKI